LALYAWKYVPKSEGLITCSGDDIRAARTHREVEHAVGVPCQRLHLAHRRVLPYDYLVEGVAVGRHQLVGRLREHQVADLGACVHAVDRLQGVRVPKTNAPIGRAATRCKETRLIWVPGNGFHGCLMLRELGDGLLSVEVPYQKLVVVATAGQLLPVVRPPEAADLLLVARIPVSRTIAHPEVSVEHHLVLGSCTYRGAIPRYRAYPLGVLPEASDLLAVVDVPYLSLTVIRAHRQVVALVAPANAGDLVLHSHFAQLLHLRCAGAPDVDCPVQADCEDIC